VVQGSLEGQKTTGHVSFRWPVRQPDDGDPGISVRGKEKWITEIQVERDETSTFRPADLDQITVAAGTEALAHHGRHVMAGGSQEVSSPVPQVLIQL